MRLVAYFTLYVSAITIMVVMVTNLPSFVSGNFVKYVRDKEDVRCTSSGTSETTGSVLYCAQLCQQDVTCNSFTESNADQVCLLHSDAVTCTNMPGYNRYVEDVTGTSSSTSTSTTTVTSPISGQWLQATTTPLGDYIMSAELLLVDVTQGSGYTMGYLRAKINGNWGDLCHLEIRVQDRAVRDQMCIALGLGIVADTLIYGTPLANRVDPDETAPTGAVSSGSTLFANSSNHVAMRSYSAPLYDVYGDAYAPNAVAYLSCTSDFSSCSGNTLYDPLVHNTCDRSGLYCSHQGTFYEDIRLADGVKSDEGRLELMVGGQWGTVCRYFIDSHAAKLMCQALGFANQCNYGDLLFPSGSGPEWYQQIRCDSSATQLSQCTITDNSVCGPAQALDLECC